MAILGLAVLKPWGTRTESQLPTVPPVAAAADPTPPGPASTPVPTPTPRPRPLVTALAFDPPPEECIDSARWRVCVIGAGDRQAVRSMFSPRRLPLLGPDAPKTRPEPAVLIATAGGAGIAFYAPLESDLLVEGTIAVSAWHVGMGQEGTRWLALEALGPTTFRSRVVWNVHLPLPDALVAAEEWPAGRYIVRLQAANGDHWDRFFALLTMAD